MPGGSSVQVGTRRIPACDLVSGGSQEGMGSFVFFLNNALFLF